MKVKTRHDHPSRVIQLPYPPPEVCQKCNKVRDVYASTIGWVCEKCIPLEDLVDEYGIKYPKVKIGTRERRDIKEIRARLTGKPLPKKLGRFGKVANAKLD